MPFIRHLRGLAVALGLALVAQQAAGPALADDLPVLKIGTLAGGTVSWELAVIREKGLDTEAGFHLEKQDFAGNPATWIALQGGEVDSIVTDWLWAAQQIAGGLDLTFIPYSTAVGGLMVRDDSGITKLADLKGKKIAISGGPVDKSWLILCAYGLKHGIDLTHETEQVFAAGPLVMQAALSGEVQGAVNLWNFMAKMRVGGMHELLSVGDAATELGLDPSTTLLGYVVTAKAIEKNPDIVDKLARASRAAKQLMASDDAIWDELRPIMNADSDAEFEALRDGWRAGIPPEGPVNRAEAEKLFEVLAELGGDQLTGGLDSLPDGMFYRSE